MGRFSSQFRALKRKNWLIWKRSKCGSCSEIFFPLFYCLMFLAMRTPDDIMEIPEISYYETGVIGELKGEPILTEETMK